MRHTIVFLAAIAGCTQNEAAKDFYDQVEHGSDWQLTFSAGTRVDDVYGSNYYMGACPSFATRTLHVPNDDGTHCDPGCTCALAFQLEDDGDVGHDYDTTISFTQSCPDKSYLQCFDTHAEYRDPVTCTWIAGTIDPSVDPFGDCEYTLDLGQTAQQ